MRNIVTNNFKETRKLGLQLAKQLKGGEVLALYGDLGAGKTTFMQGLAQGLGIAKNIISPTFIIMRTYQIFRHSGKLKAHPESVKENRSWTSQDDSLKNLYHLDLYRIETEAEAIDLGLLDLMNDPENIVAIEWPDKIENILPEDSIAIYFEYLSDDKRKIRISSSD
ncbi:MAG: tRNA (adenosine(37)-N6)-threonylcarbamoyltransferase complex ATPase subunit type 1 TsaE [Candidatus Levyibacteriota bacterium]